jgi:hypothetical protein
MMTSLRRLAQMPREEVSWRLRVRGRIERQRLSCALRRPRWNRADIGRALAADRLNAATRTAIADGEWSRVHTELHEHLLARPSRYVLDPRDAGRLRTAIMSRWPEAAGDAARRADRLLEGTYDLLGYRGVECRDWHADPINGGRMPPRFWASVPYLDPRCGDHKVIWELNRHQHWLGLGRAAWLTGNARYTDAIVTQLGSWLDANPPLVGGNWVSMLELGFRSLSWVWGLHILLGQPSTSGPRAEQPWLVDMLVGMDRQMDHVAQNLSFYFSPNTHLTGEALALYVVGTALPELARSDDWVRIGRQVLLQEIERQVAADGGHVERSMHYHRYTLDFYLLALLTAEHAGDERAAAGFRSVCARLAEFAHEMADEGGRLPMIGDDDGGMLWPIAGREPADVRDSLGIAALLLGRPALAPRQMPEEVFWVAGARAEAAYPVKPARTRTSSAVRTRVFRDTGYIVMRTAANDRLVFDVGPLGYLNAGHAHADALAVTLDVAGKPLLIDPGTGTYTIDRALRDRMRSSVSHNTVTLDDRSSAVAAGPFQWALRADGHLEAWRSNEGFSWAEAAHDGYGSVQHRRTVFHGAGAGWLILDEILGDGPHRADVHWHFDPAWVVGSGIDRGLRLTSDDGVSAWLVHDGGEVWLTRGDEQSGLGWYSPIYGRRVPTSTARISHQGTAPFSMAWWIGDGETMPSVARLHVDCDWMSNTIALRVYQGDHAWTTMLRPGETPEREGRSCSSGDYHSDGRLTHYCMCDGALRTVSLADVSQLLSLRDGLISIVSETHVEDLHCRLDGEYLEVCTGKPPARLKLEGGALAAVKTVRLNGRELGRTGEAIELLSSDWAVCVESPALSI